MLKETIFYIIQLDDDDDVQNYFVFMSSGENLLTKLHRRLYPNGMITLKMVDQRIASESVNKMTDHNNNNKYGL